MDVSKSPAEFVERWVCLHTGIDKTMKAAMSRDLSHLLFDYRHQPLSRALEVIRELMKNGEHDGPCDNVGMEQEEACSIHLATSKKRYQVAHDLLCEFPGFPR